MNRDEQFVSPRLFTDTKHTDEAGNQRLFYYNRTSEFIKKQKKINLEQAFFNQQLTMLLDSMKKEYLAFSQRVKDDFCKQDSINLSVQETLRRHEEVYVNQMDQLSELRNFYQRLNNLALTHTDRLSQQSNRISSQKQKIQEIQDRIPNIVEKQLEECFNIFRKELDDQHAKAKQLIEQLLNYERVALQHTNILDQQMEINSKLAHHINHYKSTHSQLSKEMEDIRSKVEDILNNLKDHGEVFTKNSQIFDEQNKINEKLTHHIKQVKHIQDQLTQEVANQNKLLQEFKQKRTEDEEHYSHLSKEVNELALRNNELKQRIKGTINSNGAFSHIFKDLPENYPLHSILVNGVVVDVTRFLNMNLEDNLAHFTDDLHVSTFDCQKIEGVKWGEGIKQDNNLKKSH